MRKRLKKKLRKKRLSKQKREYYYIDLINGLRITAKEVAEIYAKYKDTEEFKKLSELLTCRYTRGGTSIRLPIPVDWK